MTLYLAQAQQHGPTVDFFFNEEEFDLRIQIQGGGKQFCFPLIREQGVHAEKVTYLPTQFNYNDEYQVGLMHIFKYIQAMILNLNYNVPKPIRKSFAYLILRENWWAQHKIFLFEAMFPDKYKTEL